MLIPTPHFSITTFDPSSSISHSFTLSFCPSSSFHPMSLWSSKYFVEECNKLPSLVQVRVDPSRQMSFCAWNCQKVRLYLSDRYCNSQLVIPWTNASQFGMLGAKLGPWPIRPPPHTHTNPPMMFFVHALVEIYTFYTRTNDIRRQRFGFDSHLRMKHKTRCYVQSHTGH